MGSGPPFRRTAHRALSFMQATQQKTAHRRSLLAKTAFLMLTLLFACDANAVAPTEIELGFQSMYNLDFQKAHQNFSTWEQLHPNDPLGPVSQAAGFLF